MIHAAHAAAAAAAGMTMTGVRFTAGADTKTVEDCGDISLGYASASVDTVAAQEADPAPMTNSQLGHNPRYPRYSTVKGIMPA